MQTEKKYKLIIAGLIVGILILAWFKGCSNDEQKTIDVKVPSVSGKFESVKPEQKPIKNDKVPEIKKVFQYKDLSKKEREFLQSEISRLLAENEQLDKDFQNANDSLMQVIYKNAIEIKYFSHKWENDTLSANVKGLVRGEIQNINLDYKIKTRTVTIPNPKEVKFRLLAGVEVGNTKEFNDFKTKANIGFQNAKGAVLSIGADTEQRFYVGYTIPIITIRR